MTDIVQRLRIIDMSYHPIAMEAADEIAALRQRLNEVATDWQVMHAKLAAYKDELKAIGEALDDPRTDLSMTMVEVIRDMKEQLAVSQHYAQQLREAIEAEYRERGSLTTGEAYAAMKLPHDTSALDELRKDAERYRWLLDYGKPDLWVRCARMDSYDDVEAAIDAAMKGQS